MRLPPRCGASERTTFSTSGNSGKLDEDLSVFDARRVDRNRNGRIPSAGAGDAIEFPQVPGTGDHASVQRAVAERSAHVRAVTADRKELTIVVADRDIHRSNRDLTKCARRKIGEIRYLNERHT